MVDPKLIPSEVSALCRRLRQAGHQAHLVGGGVRDLLLGRAPADYDVATSAHPEQVMELFGDRFAIPTGLAHGTVTVLTQEGPRGRLPVEVTTFRSEGEYVDGRRPSEVRFGATLEEDLSRRDFTMNAIAYDPMDGVLTDPWHGQQDLAAGVVRAVGDPVARFREDGLRPMRAVRQAAQLGFTIDPPTAQAIPATLDVFRKVSAERVRDELFKLLKAKRPSQGIELMREGGLLGAVMPELLEGVDCAQNRFHRFDVYRHTLATLDSASAEVVVRLGALLHDVGKPRSRQPREGAPGEYSFFKHEFVGAEMSADICRRLKMSTAEREDVTALVANHMFYYTADWTDGTVRRFVRRVGRDRLPALLALREADIAGRGFDEDPRGETRELVDRVEQLASEDAALQVKDLAITGQDVMRVLGIPPSRRVGQVLEQLLERVLDDPQLNSKEGLEALLLELAART
jgi:tRNA nucleotidyltransferase (CCA-adding enzyme)